MVRPPRIFFIFALATLLLLALIAAFPSGIIPLGPGLTLRFFSLEELTHPWPRERVDIEQIIETVATDSLAADSTRTLVVETDSAEAPDTLCIDPAQIARVQHRIQFPEGSMAALETFFAALDKVRRTGRGIHILHYGDSQVEGDRVTSVIREHFQGDERFGGCGPGLIPVRGVLQGSASYFLSQSDNWTEYATFRKNPVEPPHRLYGVTGSFFRFIPYPEPDTLPPAADSLVADSIPVLTADTLVPGEPQPDSAWIEIRRRGGAAPHVQRFDRIRLFYTLSGEPVRLRLLVNGNPVSDEWLQPAPGLLEATWPLTEGFRDIRFEFSGTNSPDVIGISLECSGGIKVDNLGMRGSAVTNFTAMSPAALARHVQMLNVPLVILQFGVNVVPNVVNSYRYYENMMYRQIMALKQAVPGISVLVIGVSDMARKEGTAMESYPNIEKIRDAQRNAAFRSGSAFWDLYEAMGGHNSMVSWVEHDPPYAGKDYTHFNPRGARIIGQMIYDALMESYYRYKGAIQ